MRTSPRMVPAADPLDVLDALETELSIDGGDTTTSSTESGAESPTASAAVRTEHQAGGTKKRKATYYVRRDTIKSLREQLSELEKELSVVRLTATAALREAQQRTLLYEQGIVRNHLALAGSESTISAYKLAMESTSTIPLKTYVRMPAEPSARQMLLQSMWRPKLDDASRFMAERMRFLDVRYDHKSEDTFTLPNGDYISVSCEITPFTSGHSVKQVFDALASFILSQEISISEQLGVLTIRENDDIDGRMYGHSRYLSATPVGVMVETNMVMFATFEEANAAEGTSAFAVAAVDFVDEDDLHPYRPDSCARKDMTVALTITETTTETGTRVVSLCKWGYVRLRMPTYPLSDDEASSVRDVKSGFAAVMHKVMCERLAMEVPSP